MGMTTAIIGGAALVGTAAMGYMSAGNAADAQVSSAQQAAQTSANASSEANRTQLEMYYQSREDLAPWRETGVEALSALGAKVAGGPPVFDGPGEYTESDEYDLLVGEGINALDRSASARGRLNSGAHEKSLIRFAEDEASKDVDRFLGRYYDKANFQLGQYYNALTPLQSLAGVGQTATNQTGALGATTAGNVSRNILTSGQNIANSQIAAGNARASGYLNQSNALTGAVDTGLSAYLLH